MSSDNSESICVFNDHKNTTQWVPTLTIYFTYYVLTCFFYHTNKWWLNSHKPSHCQLTAPWLFISAGRDIIRWGSIHGVRTGPSLWSLAALPAFTHPKTYSERSSCPSRPDFRAKRCLRKGYFVYAWQECWKQGKLRKRKIDRGKEKIEAALWNQLCGSAEKPGCHVSATPDLLSVAS